MTAGQGGLLAATLAMIVASSCTRDGGEASHAAPTVERAPGSSTPIADGQPSTIGEDAPGSSTSIAEGRAASSNADAYVVTFASDPDPIPLNEPFAIDLVVRHADGRPAADIELVVDGRMPHHRHGMNQTPTVEPLGAGRFRVTDMLFHMSGRWELHVDITEDGVTERAQFTVQLQ